MSSPKGLSQLGSSCTGPESQPNETKYSNLIQAPTSTSYPSWLNRDSSVLRCVWVPNTPEARIPHF